jgi:hypothetical protein
MTPEERAAHKAELQKSLEDLEALEKGAPIQELTGGSELVKAVTAAILSSEERMSNLYMEKAQALGTLANESIELMKAFEERFEERLSDLEEQPLGSRAVLTKGFQPKPGQEFDKGEGGNEIETYSISGQKAQLCTRLTDLAIEKAQGVENIDKRLKADLIALEAGNHLSDSVWNFAKANNIQIIN